MGQRKRIVIVGGVAGGASAAAKARRMSEEAEIVLVERGNDISFANCGLPYHVGGIIPDRARLLVQSPQAMRQRFAVDVRTRSEVLRINRPQKTVVVHDKAKDRQYEQPYDVLILSPGAEPVRPPIPGADHKRVFTLRSLADMDAIKAVVDGGKGEKSSPTMAAVVVGGGYIGLEMTEVLAHRGLAVSLVELEPQVMGPIDPEMATPLHEHLRQQGVDLCLNSSVTAIQEREGQLEVRLSTGRLIPCGLVILAIGVRPEARLAAEAGLTIGQRKGIVVDDHMRTSDPDIYAVGDAVEVQDLVGGFPTVIPLAGPANRQGRIAAINALGGDAIYERTQGTAICKVFDLAVGMTGLSEKALKRAGLAYEKVYVHPASHAGYYPGATQMSLKLLFDPGNGKILGAQCVGAHGVDKRIDVLAVAIRAGMTVYDLEKLELAYAPPFGSAKDPVNYAGFVAANTLRKEVGICHVPDVVNPGPKQLLLDVRTAPEVQQGTIPGSIHIPIDELRGRLGELPKDKEVLAFCQVGLRGYLACRILSQNGVACRNLTGGYKTYGQVMGLMSAKPKILREIKEDTGHVGSVPVGAGPRACPGQPQGVAPTDGPVQVVKEIDACGLQCPGPIMQLKQAMDQIQPGQAVRISVSEPAFAADLDGWCHTTGSRLRDKQFNKGVLTAVVEKGQRQFSVPSSQFSANCQPGTANSQLPQKTLVVFSDAFDKAMAAFIIANGATAMGSDVTMFFTFWGLNLLRRAQAVPVRKTFIERMFGWMMPRGADKTSLSQMNMGGMGTAMIKGIMRKKNVLSLPELITAAQKSGVRLVACTMTMDLMGIKREELLDGVEEGGVAMYLDRAGSANVNLFIG
jgi:NADPH-dependent 2,4-dienoyl-CoA reductase/sulfur reductase-like enzyme/peroxiredoxin family protein/rhodanese-related sulfurtransferase/TusA-related sulfurtransferase